MFYMVIIKVVPVMGSVGSEFIPSQECSIPPP
jgi:hypothetical protein